MSDQTRKLAGRLLMITAVFVLGGLALSAHASVQEYVLNGLPEDPRNLCDFLLLIVNIKNLVFMIAAPITILMIIIGGVMYSATGGSTGSGDKLSASSAKKIITSGVIGLVIVLCAWLIVGGVITALYGQDVGSAWWTIKDCPTTSASTPPQP